ncbi:MAG: helix-turn-helix domain-containing protein [Burkholderiales bacterium]|nr:helix-turn-helix domain-containing protein [Burkholderiales bacterium]
MTLAADDAFYLALQARDARFDGCFFTGVTSTGIYCRPVCRVRTPRRENCRFFGHAAQAEAAGFRPCLRCRPELAPHSIVWSIQDASYILAHQAARWLDDPEAWSDAPPSPAQLAGRLGVSDRHLRRIFEAQFGVSPLQYLQTRRLLTAKQLLADTHLPIAQVALASGFASLRRFNAAFVEHYGLNPTQLRRQEPARRAAGIEGSVVRLGYRPPYDVTAMLGFLERRHLPGIEWVDASPATPRLARTLRLRSGGHTLTGWLACEFDAGRSQVVLRVSDGLRTALPQVIQRVRSLLDLDADPKAINATLLPHFPGSEGLRVPGTVDGYELAMRAVLGQQITVAAARTLARRLAERFGEPVATPLPELTHLFPAPEVLAAADPDALGQLGIVRQRQAALRAIARATADGTLPLHPGVPYADTVRRLCELPGIGDWTAQYIAMRALRWPDAFPAGDIALQKALDTPTARTAEAASQAWKPWRSYAVLRAWDRPPETTRTTTS